MSLAKTKSEYMLDILDQYKAAGNEWPAEKRDVAAWAVEHDLWEPQLSDKVKLCGNALASAFKEESVVNDQGVRVRSMASGRIEVRGPQGEKIQRHLWCEIAIAPRWLLKAAFDQQAGQIKADCQARRLQIEYANQVNPECIDEPLSDEIEGIE